MCLADSLSRTSNASSVTAISSAFALKFQKVKKRFLEIKPHRKLSIVRILERTSYFACVANSSYIFARQKPLELQKENTRSTRFTRALSPFPLYTLAPATQAMSHFLPTNSSPQRIRLR